MRVKSVSRQRAVSTQGQARRVGRHELGARYTAFSMIPGNGVYRVRRRRFAEARSGSIIGSIIGGSIIGAPSMETPTSAW